MLIYVLNVLLVKKISEQTKITSQQHYTNKIKIKFHYKYPHVHIKKQIEKNNCKVIQKKNECIQNGIQVVL